MTRAPSKTLAAWLGLVAGAVGAARVYLHGWGDRWAWVHLAAAAAGGYGAWRMRHLGVDDRIGSVLVPLLGVSLAAALLSAIVTALTAESRWHALHGAAADGRTGPLAVLAAVFSLAGGAIVGIATIVFVIQRAFEWTMG